MTTDDRGMQKPVQDPIAWLQQHITEVSGPRPDDQRDDDLVYRFAKRVGQVIAVVAEPSPSIDDYEDDVRRGIEDGHAEMLAYLRGRSTPSDDGGGSGE